MGFKLTYYANICTFLFLQNSNETGFQKSTIFMIFKNKLLILKRRLVYMKMLRTFHPIGQGGFYSERFISQENNNINIIYDCGSATSIKIVQQEIKTTFKKGEVIHALFISHFHADHINGIEFLLDYCHVKKIFFPLITAEHKSLLKIKLLIEQDSNEFLFNFIDKPKDTVKKLLKSKGDEENSLELIAVSWNEKNEKNKERENNKEIYDEIISSGIDVTSMISERFDKLLWEYIPYNFERVNRLEELKNYEPFRSTSFEKLCSSLQTTDKNTRKAKILEIKAAFEKVSGDLNSNSMTLYSGMYNKGIISVSQGVNKKNYCLPCCRMDNVGCLYTGDYDASKVDTFKDLKEKYKYYWYSIKFIQVPHHGSEKNFNSGFLEFDKYFVISVGLKSRYKHPSVQVISEILLSGGNLLIVTEDSRSVVKNLIEILC